jgi:hypothetical protein
MRSLDFLIIQSFQLQYGLVLTQLLAEISIRNFLEGKRRPAPKADLTAIGKPIV